jgi:hypothetical protein
VASARASGSGTTCKAEFKRVKNTTPRRYKWIAAARDMKSEWRYSAPTDIHLNYPFVQGHRRDHLAVIDDLS